MKVWLAIETNSFGFEKLIRAWARGQLNSRLDVASNTSLAKSRAKRCYALICESLFRLRAEEPVRSESLMSQYDKGGTVSRPPREPESTCFRSRCQRPTYHIVVPRDKFHRHLFRHPEYALEPGQVVFVLFFPKDASTPVHHVSHHDHRVHASEPHGDVPALAHVEIDDPRRQGLKRRMTGRVGQDRMRDLRIGEDEDVCRFWRCRAGVRV